MEETTEAVVAALWRYPVKSMQGEPLEALYFEGRGAKGDRLYAIRESDGRLGSGKTTSRFRRIAGLLQLRATYRDQVLLIHLPTGESLAGDDPAIDQALSSALSQPVTLVKEDGESHFDVGPVHLITTASLNLLRSRLAQIDERRFRPNLVIDTGAEGFIEDQWVGRTLRFGGGVELVITEPTERCVMVNLPQADLDENAAVLRELTAANQACFGVYAHVSIPGLVRLGESTSLL